MRKIDLIEIVPVALCMLFAIAISLYHVSFDGFLGLSKHFWGATWAISENGFALMLCWLLSLHVTDIMRAIFKYVFIPYFTLKLIYHFSCYSGIYFLAKETWVFIWSVACICLLISCLVYCLILIHKRHV